MKKTIYTIFLSAVGLMVLGSCGGRDEYDAYVTSLKAQPAVIDTISSAESYANYLDTLALKAKTFDEQGLKLDPTQKDEISALAIKIQQALTCKYNQLAQQPALADTVMVADAPVEAFDEAGKGTEL